MPKNPNCHIVNQVFYFFVFSSLWLIALYFQHFLSYPHTDNNNGLGLGNFVRKLHHSTIYLSQIIVSTANLKNYGIYHHMPTLEKIHIMETPDTNATKMNFDQGSSK